MLAPIRVLVGLAGIAGLCLAILFLVDPERQAAALGLKPQDILGLATLRADLPGFFGAGGILAVAAALRNRAPLLTAPVLLIAIALFGRALSYGLNGGGMPVIQPMIVEATLLAIFGLGRMTLALEQKTGEARADD